MSRLLGLKKVPVFAETGDAKITTDYGKNIPDYPTTGKTGDHWGLDLVRCTDGETSELATICAIADGVVFAQRKWVEGFNRDASAGNCVYILHDDGLTITKYFHLKYGSVPERIEDNVRVKKGEVLGYMGATGYAYGAHLHFQVEKLKEPPKEITWNISGATVDPEPYLTGDIVIGGEKEYAVQIGTFGNKKDAEDVAAALKTLGTDSAVIEL